MNNLPVAGGLSVQIFFAIVTRRHGDVFPENTGKMPRGRKAEVQTDGSQRLICVAEEVFCLLRFPVKYKIRERDITFCPKTF